MNPQTPQNKLLVRFAFILYILAALVLIPKVANRLNPDGVSYISISSAYVQNDWGRAINGTWSPLFPVLLSPFLAANIDPIFASHLLQTIIGLLFLMAIKSLLEKFELDSFVLNISIYILIPITIYFAFFSISADLLVSAILIAYLCLILDKNYEKSLVFGLFAGLLGGVAYLSRTYAFPFFVIHFTLTNFIFLKNSNTATEKRIIKRNFTIGMLVFLLISLVWVSVLYQKYGFVTLGTASKYNFRVLNPIYKSLSEHPLFSLGITNPPYAKSLSAWEDLTTYTDIYPNWNPIGSLSNFYYTIKTISQNIINMLTTLIIFSPFSIPILFGFFALRTEINKNARLKILIMSGILFLIGFLPFKEYLERHIWFSLVILFIYSIITIPLLIERWKIKFPRTVLVLILLSFVIKPLVFIAYSSLPATSQKNRFFESSADTYILAQNLKSLGMQGGFVSNKYGSGGIVLSYYLNSPYFGVIRETLTQDMITNFKKIGISYYIYWKASPATPQELNEYKKYIIYETNSIVVLKLTQEENTISK